MWSFRNNRLLEPVDVTVANLMAALGRYQGRQELCQRQSPQIQVDRLLIVNAFILDFLCIHPFSDGNGRLARLLALLLLYAAGYEVGRYISPERIIEQTKETYYEALHRSGERWDTGQHDLTPWHQYSLSVLVYAYREFEERMGAALAGRGAKSRLVVQTIERLPERFTIGMIEQLCPTVSRATIKRVLRRFRDDGKIACIKTGRDAEWEKTGSFNR